MNRHGSDESHGKDAKAGGERNGASEASASDSASERLLPPRGDYQTLLSFQKAEVVYDITFRFAHKHLARSDRTIDQMIQSARSGKKNILEGSKAGLTSKETEIKLTNVARASLEELLDDYRDYLRARDLPIWDKDSREAKYVRQLGRKTQQTYELYREFVESRPPEVVANIAICLIHQTNYLIDQQLRRLEQDFVEQGGLRERMTRVRTAYRSAKPNKPATNRPPDSRQPNPPTNAHNSPTPNTSPDSRDSQSSHKSHDSQPRKPGPSGGTR
jgi:four helix bundle suffix protein